MDSPNKVWLNAIEQVSFSPDNITSPRGMQVKECIGFNYSTDLDWPVITHKARKLNYKFMFAEAAWILQGRNDLAYIKERNSNYASFSDDGVTLNGAYGPKVMDQFSWAASEIANDIETRRAYINIWRERPGPSKDLPCTTGLQFIVRDNVLNLVAYMRSQDAVWGMPYDIFTFSAIAKYMQLYLYEVQNVPVSIGKLHVNVGSFHIYERHWEDAITWLGNKEANQMAETYYKVSACVKPNEYIENLRAAA